MGQTLLLSLYMKWHIVFRLVRLHLTLTISKCYGQGHAYCNCGYLANEKYGTDCYCQQIWSRKWLFDLHIYIWPWSILNLKVKVMQIFAVSITQTVTYILSIAVANKCEVAHMAFRSACINLIFTFSKGQRHDHAHLDCEYRANRGRWGKHYQTLLLPTNTKVTLRPFN